MSHNLVTVGRTSRSGTASDFELIPTFVTYSPILTVFARLQPHLTLSIWHVEILHGFFPIFLDNVK